MTDDLASLQAETEAALAAATDLRALDAVRVGVMGKSGSLSGLLKGLGAVPAEGRKERGAALNRLKGSIEAAIEARRVGARRRRAGRPPGRRAPRRHPAAAPLRPRHRRRGRHPPDRPHHRGTDRPVRRHGLQGRRRPGHRGRLVQFRRAQHPRPPSGAAGPRHLLPAGGGRPPPRAAHPHLPGADPHHDRPGTADPRHRPRPHLSRRP